MPPPAGTRQAFRLSGAAPAGSGRTRAQARAGAPPAQARPKPARQRSTPSPAEPVAVEQVDSRYLESLIGYNARRAALAVIAVFLERMAPYGLRPVDFSVLSLITHNPGITARQLCNALGLLPPNMVGVMRGFERRGLIERRPHPTDRRAQGLHLTPEGQALMHEAERTALQLEQDVAHRLSPQEQRTLMGLLQKIYL